MSALRSILFRMRGMLGGRQAEADFNAELASHLEMHIDDGVRAGLAPEEARRQALVKLGGMEAAREAHRERRGFVFLESLQQDVRQGIRSLRRSPGFTAVGVATLAISIGATVSFFSVIDATLLAPWRAMDSGRLVWINEFSADGQPSGGTPLRMADWQRLRSLAGVAGIYDEGLVLSGEGAPRRLDALRTFGPTGEVLHARLVFGRMPTEAERQGREPVVLLTEHIWRSVFQSNPAILGRPLHLNGQAYPVIGVLSKDVAYPEGVDIWIPAPAAVQATSREAGFLGQFARLAPGATLESANAELAAVAGQLGEKYPATDRGRRATLVSLEEHVTASSRGPLLTLFGGVLCVLLVACINVAGLLLARALGRRREASIRLALGAGRGRLVRSFLVEGLLLSAAGGAAGLLLATFGIELLKQVLPADTPHLLESALNWRVVAFTGVAIGASALLCGVIPALQLVSRVRVDSLNVGARNVGGPREGVRSKLVMIEVAASVVLLVTAGLLAGNYLRMRQAPLGFRPDGALSFTVLFPWDTPEGRLNAYAKQVLTRLETLGGVEAVGIVDRLPLHGGSQSGPVVVRDVALTPSEAERSMGWRTATPGYFGAAGVPMLAGKLFGVYRDAGGPREAVVNERFARLRFGDTNPIGREVARREGTTPPRWFRIVGVVGDTRERPSDREAEPEVYVPWGATYWPVMNFVVRSPRPAAGLAQDIRRAIQPLTQNQAIEQIAPVQTLMDETESGPRGRAWLLLLFAGVATGLSGVGIFGLLSQEVARRTPEFGLRLALGADGRDLLWSTTWSGMRLVTIGLVGGIGASLAVARIVGGLVGSSEAFPTENYLWGSFAWSGAVILVTAFAASVLPSLRAARIEPVTALRGD